MKRHFRNNKAFSMIELLVALLIMAVISAVLISLYAGLLKNTQNNADKETAREIRKQLLIYMTASNDVNLSCLNTTSGNSVVDALSTGITITSSTPGKDANDLVGNYGSYFEKASPRPQEKSNTGWNITVDPNKMTVEVTASTGNGAVSFAS